MKKIITVIVIVIILILICITAGYFWSVKNINKENNDVLTIKRDINNKEFSNAQIVFNKLKDRGYSDIQEKNELDLQIETGIFNKKYDELSPFLNNSKLVGKIDDKYSLTMMLNNSEKIGGNILAKEYYDNYPNNKLDLKIMFDSQGKCTIDEADEGNPVGIYRLSFNDKTAQGTYEYAPSGKITPITLTFIK